MTDKKEVELIEFVFNVSTEKVTKKPFEGVEHMVIPVKAAKEMVMNNRYYPKDFFERTSDSWNGVPVPVNHPVRIMNTGEKKNILANTPKILDAVNIGRFFNAEWDGDFLKGELWIDPLKAERTGNYKVINALNNKETLEVSTAGTAKVIHKEGVFNGKAYKTVVVDIVPDHIAVLNNEEGACSLKDGCGCGVTVTNCDCEVEDVSVLEKAYKMIGTKLGLVFNKKEHTSEEASRDVTITDDQKIEAACSDESNIAINKEKDMSESKEVTTESVVKEPVTNKAETLEEVLELVGNEKLKETITNAVENYASVKKGLFDDVVEKTKFTEEEASVFTYNQLSKILESLTPKADYSGRQVVAPVSNRATELPNIKSIEDMFKGDS